jgi:hypothetical protein
LGNKQAATKALISSLSLDEAREAITKLIQFVKQSGEEYAEIMIAASRWGRREAREQLPSLFEIVAADSAFEGRPEIDEEVVRLIRSTSG